MSKQLTGLQEKIFIDRYALKNPNGKNAKVGDTVMVLVSENEHGQTKAVGEVTHILDNDVSVRLRDGVIIATTTDKVSIASETEPPQLWDRLATAISNVEQTDEKRAYWRERFRDLLDDWKLVPGGRIAAGAGASDELTLFNCYVIPSPHDSRGGIMRTLSEMTEIMSRGGGKLSC